MLLGKYLHEILGQCGVERGGIYADVICSHAARYIQVLPKCHGSGMSCDVWLHPDLSTTRSGNPLQFGHRHSVEKHLY